MMHKFFTFLLSRINKKIDAGPVVIVQSSHLLRSRSLPQLFSILLVAIVISYFFVFFSHLAARCSRSSIEPLGAGNSLLLFSENEHQQQRRQQHNDAESVMDNVTLRLSSLGSVR